MNFNLDYAISIANLESSYDTKVQNFKHSQSPNTYKLHKFVISHMMDFKVFSPENLNSCKTGNVSMPYQQLENTDTVTHRHTKTQKAKMSTIIRRR